jgi:transcriptional regulator GlxA family with amidase domain
VQIAIVLFDRLTALDAIGPYEVLSRLPGATTVFAGARTGPVRTDNGRLALTVDAAFADVPSPDLVVVPGGPGQADHMDGSPVLDWLRAVEPAWLTSVCTGSLLLAAAGLLTGRRATSHWLALDQLAGYGAEPVRERVVFDGNRVTSAGVSAGIDMALTLVGRIAGDAVAQTIQLAIEYAPEPPYDAGTIDTAPPEVVAALRARSRFVLTGQS